MIRRSKELADSLSFVRSGTERLLGKEVVAPGKASRDGAISCLICQTVGPYLLLLKPKGNLSQCWECRKVRCPGRKAPGVRSHSRDRRWVCIDPDRAPRIPAAAVCRQTCIHLPLRCPSHQQPHALKIRGSRQRGRLIFLILELKERCCS